MSESELEAELRALRPARPSSELQAAIAREMALPVPARTPAAGWLQRRSAIPLWSFLKSLCWASAGAAVAVGLLMVWSGRSHAGSGKNGKNANDGSYVASAPAVEAATAAPEVAETDLFEALDSERDVLASEDSGFVYDEDEGPAQIVRYSSVERHAWSNPATGASVIVEVPREDVFLIPLAYQ